MFVRYLAALLIGGAGMATFHTQSDSPAYLFYVASESEDEVTLLRFSPDEGLTVEKVITVGTLPTEIEGPHGIFVDPSGEHWYLTLGHCFPFCTLWK